MGGLNDKIKDEYLDYEPTAGELGLVRQGRPDLQLVKEPHVAVPEVWANLIEALTIMSNGDVNKISPFHCEHDELTVCCDPASLTTEQLERLELLGFHAQPDDGSFRSTRFGSA